MLTNKERMVIGSLIIVCILILGVSFFLFGETLITALLTAIKYVLFWLIGGVIVLSFLFMIYMTFFKSETAKELFHAIIMGKNFDE